VARGACHLDAAYSPKNLRVGHRCEAAHCAGGSPHARIARLNPAAAGHGPAARQAHRPAWGARRRTRAGRTAPCERS
jgi:hypothetical protein